MTTIPFFGAGFGAGFNPATNRIGRINLPWGNKMEDNISVNSALDEGFISVTVDGEVTGALDATAVGEKVNYVIVKSGITGIAALNTTNIDYLEINMTDKSEIAWNVANAEFTGLIVLSKVNIKQGTTITVTGSTFLGATMYVGGEFNNASWNGYFGDTETAVATKYVTY